MDRNLDRRRPGLRALLVAGMIVAAAGLVAVIALRPEAGPAEPPLARATGTVRLRVQDADGQPLRTAIVYALPSQGAGPGSQRWLPDEAVLELPPGPHPHSALATARGYRLQRVDGLLGEHRVTLEPGLAVRVALRNLPAEPPGPAIRFLLRIRPDESLLATTPGLDAATLVDLMDNRGRAGSGPTDMPRGEFGYAVSAEQARAGLLLPAPGRYHLHWGLMDLDAGTWFSLGDQCGRAIEVRDRVGDQVAELDVTDGHLQETLVGLRSSVQRLDGR